METLSTKPTFVDIFTRVFMKLEDLLRDPTLPFDYSFRLQDLNKTRPVFEITLFREPLPNLPDPLPEELCYIPDKALVQLQTVLGINWKLPEQQTAEYLGAENLTLLLSTFQSIAGAIRICASKPGTIVFGFDRCRVIFIRHDLQ